MSIPRDGSLDATFALLRQGYNFVSNRCRALGSDAFRTRLMLTPAVCIRGEEAARVFYTPERFARRRAMPANTFRLLQDYGSVATLDGAAHHHRKRMFLDLLTPPEAIARLCAAFEEAWREALPEWERQPRLVLHQALHPVLFRAVCGWAGLEWDEAKTEAYVRDVVAIIDHLGVAGPANWRAQLQRNRSNIGCGTKSSGSVATPRTRTPTAPRALSP